VKGFRSVSVVGRSGLLRPKSLVKSVLILIIFLGMVSDHGALVCPARSWLSSSPVLPDVVSRAGYLACCSAPAYGPDLIPSWA
jgi:hypothetical protein